MRLRHIEIFHAIYTTGTVTNAAKLLHVSQPSVSKVLAHAETQLGFSLFERVNGRLKVTNEAELLFGEVDKVYHQLRIIKNTAKKIKSYQFGKISLGIAPGLSYNIVPQAIARFHLKRDQVYFNIKTVANNDILTALHQHEYELAILNAPSYIPGVKVTELAQSELVIVYPKELIKDCPDKLKLNQLVKFKFIELDEDSPLEGLLWARMQEEKIKVQSLLKVQSYSIAASLVSQGLGICVVDRHTAQGNLTESQAIASFDPPLQFPIKAIYLEDRILPQVTRDFIPYLKRVISAK